MHLRQELHKVAALRHEVQELSKKAEALEDYNRQLLAKVAHYERIQEAEELICKSSSLDHGHDMYRAYTIEDFLIKRASLAKESKGFLKEASKLIEFMNSGRISPSFLSDEPDRGNMGTAEDQLDDVIERRLQY